MERAAKRRLKVLGAASALATAGTVWLGIKAADRAPDWAAAAAGSPLAVRCLALMAGGVVVLGLLAGLLVRARSGPRAPARALHGDQGGTAAVEMALVFPFALMIFLVVTQAALLFNANMVVHYASFMATRMATVVVPSEVNDELANLVYGPDQGVSEKREIIRRAAVLALLPISAELKSAAMTDYSTEALPGLEEGVDNQTRSVFHYAGTEDKPWFRRIKKQYYYANAYTQIELAPPEHWQDGDPDPDCPYRRGRRPSDRYTLPNWWEAWEPICPFYHRDLPIWDFGYWEDLEVRLTYQFLLEVPYAGRLMGTSMPIPARPGRSYATEIQVVTKLSNEGGPELKPPDAP